MRWWLLLGVATALGQQGPAVERLRIAAERAVHAESREKAVAALRRSVEAARDDSDLAYSEASGALMGYLLGHGDDAAARAFLNAEGLRSRNLRSQGLAFPADAERLYRRLWESSPGEMELASGFAELLCFNGKPDEAATVWTQAAERAGSGLVKAGMLRALYRHFADYGRAAEARQTEGKLVEAARLNDADPSMDTVMTWSVLRQFYEESGRTDAAADVQRRIESATPRAMQKQRAAPVVRPVTAPALQRDPELQQLRQELAELARRVQADEQAAEQRAQQDKLAIQEHIRGGRTAQAEEALGRPLSFAGTLREDAAARVFLLAAEAAGEFVQKQQVAGAVHWQERIAMAAKARLYGPSPALENVMMRLAASYRAAGRLPEYRALLRERLAIHEQSGSDASAVLKALGQLRLEQCQCVEAAAFFRQALQYAEQRKGDVHPGLIEPLLELGAVFDAAGAPEADARAPLERAWAIAAKLPVRDIQEQDSRRGAVLAALALHWHGREQPREVTEVRMRARSIGGEVEFLRQFSLRLEMSGKHEAAEIVGREYDKLAAQQRN